MDNKEINEVLLVEKIRLYLHSGYNQEEVKDILFLTAMMLEVGEYLSKKMIEIKDDKDYDTLFTNIFIKLIAKEVLALEASVDKNEKARDKVDDKEKIDKDSYEIIEYLKKNEGSEVFLNADDSNFNMIFKEQLNYYSNRLGKKTVLVTINEILMDFVNGTGN
jgi:hypothetical protein